MPPACLVLVVIDLLRLSPAGSRKSQGRLEGVGGGLLLSLAGRDGPTPAEL